MGKISNKWRKMADIFLRFVLIQRHPEAPQHFIDIWDKHDAYLDTSEEAALEAYERESSGIKHPLIRSNGKTNAFMLGKKRFNLTVTEYWIPDIKNGELKPFELYLEFPKWFLDRELPEEYQLSQEEYDSLDFIK